MSPDALSYIFFGKRNYLATNPLSLYDHSNGALRLLEVWLSKGNDFENRLLRSLGYVHTNSQSHLGETSDYLRGDSAIRILKKAFENKSKIIGLTVEVKDISLTKAYFPDTAILQKDQFNSLVVDNFVGNAFLEFRQLK